jgi:hypothetical protein
MHVSHQRLDSQPTVSLIIMPSVWLLLLVLRMAQIIFRNVRLGHLSARAYFRQTVLVRNPPPEEDQIMPLEDAVHVHVKLVKSWDIRAGQTVYLTLPGVPARAPASQMPASASIPSRRAPQLPL